MVESLESLIQDGRIPEDIRNRLKDAYDRDNSEHQRLKAEEIKKAARRIKQYSTIQNFVMIMTDESYKNNEIESLDKALIEGLKNIFGSEFNARMYEVVDISNRKDIQDYLRSIDGDKPETLDLAFKSIIDTRDVPGPVDYDSDIKKHISIIVNNVTRDVYRNNEMIFAKEITPQFDLPAGIIHRTIYGRGRFFPFVEERIGFPVNIPFYTPDINPVNKIIMLDKKDGNITKEEIEYARDVIMVSSYIRDLIAKNYQIRSFAHDVNSAEAGIRGLLNLVVKKASSDEEVIPNVDKNKIRLYASRAIDSLDTLMISARKKLDRKNVEKPQEFYVSDIFEREVSIKSKVIESYGIKIIYKNIDDVAIFDYKSIYHEAVQVLLNNTIEATIEKKLQGKIEVSIEVNELDDKIVFIYRDNAGGMKDSDFQRLLGPEEFTTKKKGHGIGVNNIKESYKDRVDIKNIPGEGLEYTITFYKK